MRFFGNKLTNSNNKFSIQTYMQNILDCSFLEVTINSNKLMNILQKLTRQTNENTSQIRILREVIPTIKQSVCTSLETTESRMKFEMQRNTLKIRQQITALKLAIDSLESDMQKWTINTQKKFKEKQTQIQKLEQQKKRIQTLINIYQENRLTCQNTIFEQLDSNKESVAAIEKQIHQSDCKIDEKFQMMFIKVQSLIKKNSINWRGREGGSFQGRGRMARNSSITPNRGSITPTSMANWAKFSTKISQFEKKCEQNEQCLPAMNKVIYSRKRQQQQKEQNKQNEISQIQEQSYDQQEMNIGQINQLFSHLNEQNKKIMESLKNKVIVQQQKTGINSRKLQKITQTLNQFRLMLKRLEEKKGEDHNYQSMKNQVKKIQYQLTEELEKKVNKDIYEKEKKKIFDKLYIIQENLTEKAEKGDMKKAFLFMEEKIKQLIVLIASDQGEEKDGAIRKVPVKCLSCDKGLQTENTPPNTMPNPSLTCRQNQNLTRAVTRKIRTRIQASSQNLSGNF